MFSVFKDQLTELHTYRFSATEISGSHLVMLDVILMKLYLPSLVFVLLM